jgi:pimeloyl-ACP methyl ester carboxylesterase
MYKGMMHTRCDEDGTAFYFSAEDFAGLKKEPYSFASSAGHTLQGYLYSYGDPIEGRIIVFDHGFGGGHRAYMKEIEMLCRRGYLVLSYDHTGCMESGGDSPRGMAQSLCDLNDCITAVKADTRFAGTDISVMGHSWGGFSTLNICALHPDVSHVVVLSGFVCVEDLVNSFFGGLLCGYRKAVLNLEKSVNPSFVGYNAVESLSGTNAQALLVYSENDMLVKKSHYDRLKSGLSDKDNVRFLLVKNKGHNPNYTEDAVGYLGEFSAKRTKLLNKKNLTAEEKRAFIDSWDWNRMTTQDDAVWKEIFECLER